MDKPQIHVVSLSGGKDSTAMLLRMLEEKMPVDIILFCDTGLEFPELYEHLDKIERNTGLKVTRIKAPHSYEYYFSEVEIKRKRSTAFSEKYGVEHNGYGWAGPKMRWCTEVLKTRPRERFLSELRQKYDVIEYVGLAADEQYRLERKCNQRSNCRHPLVDWNMTERDCLNYCLERGYDWGGLYEKMRRVSCWCCPLQSLKELRVLYKDYPQLWSTLKRWDKMTWRNFRADYSVESLEKRFDLEKEWLELGKDIKSKEFYAALKERLRTDDER